jgi:hypothetical protein
MSTPVFWRDDAVAALVMSLTAAEHATTDTRACREHHPRHACAHQRPVAAVLH